MNKYKKIYGFEEALVADDVINADDQTINDMFPESRAGMMIYNVGFRIAKQKGLDGHWIAVSATGTPGTDGKDGADGKSAYDIAKELNPDIGTEQEWIASLKGKDGAPGKEGKSVKALSINVDTNGKVTGGTATLSDDSTIAVSVVNVIAAGAVPAYTDKTSFYGKTVSDLVEDGIRIESDGSVVGTLKYVTGYTEFSGDPAEQSGHYFPIRLNAPYAGKSVTVTGEKKTTSTDSEWVLIVKSTDSTFKFEADGAEIFTLNFRKATLADG